MKKPRNTIRILIYVLVPALILSLSGCGSAPATGSGGKRVWPEDLSTWNRELLDTGGSVPWLGDFEKEALFALNMVRSDPPRYAEEIVKPLLSAYSGKIWKVPGFPAAFTEEGKTAARELYEKLLETPSCPLLYPADNLTEAAREHALDQKENGTTGHESSGGRTFEERLRFYGKYLTLAAETIAYNYEDPHLAILGLLINDGEPERTHRKTILNPVLHKAGLWRENHPRMNSSLVITYADNFFSWRSSGHIGPVPDISGWEAELTKNVYKETELSALEMDYIQAVNMLRTDPVRYAEQIILPLREYRSGDVMMVYGGNGMLLNGAGLLDQLAVKVKELPPLDPLLPSRGLSRGARECASAAIREKTLLCGDMSRDFAGLFGTIDGAFVSSTLALREMTGHAYLLNNLVAAFQNREGEIDHLSFLREDIGYMGISIRPYPFIDKVNPILVKIFLAGGYTEQGETVGE